MPQTQYNLHLKGFVGGADFYRNYVDYVLSKNAGKEVNVLIDSLGGNLATALSIAAAFKNHGKVSVHFVGMNASAATNSGPHTDHTPTDFLPTTQNRSECFMRMLMLFSFALCFRFRYFL